MKRKIKAHKGGRDVTLAIHMTASERDLVNSEARKAGKTQADYIISLVMKSIEKEAQELKG